MWNNGLVYSNDIEMMLEAFCTNEWQYYIEYNNRVLSPAIRLPQEFW